MKLRVDIVGCGKFADFHVQQVQVLDSAEVVTVCDLEPLMAPLEGAKAGRADVIVANLLSRADCAKVVVDADAIIHCAAGMGSGATNIYMNTVVATRNLLDAMGDGRRRRLVLVSGVRDCRAATGGVSQRRDAYREPSRAPRRLCAREAASGRDRPRIRRSARLTG